MNLSTKTIGLAAVLLGLFGLAACDNSGGRGDPETHTTEDHSGHDHAGHDHSSHGHAEESLQPGNHADEAWCSEHGVPEDICTRCNPKLIAEFKAHNDWCAEHGLPESQCLLCNPELKEKFAAMRPARKPSRATPEAGVKLERVPRLLAAENDPLCPVDTLRVQFVDASVREKAGIETAPVRQRHISASINVPAEVEFDDTRVARITPLAAGTVRRVVAKIGAEVQAGDLLAVIDSPMLGEAKSAYIGRQQDHRLALADLEREQTIYAGTERLLDIVTAQADPDKLDSQLEAVPVGRTKAQLLRAHAALQLARAQAAREKQLLNKNISSEQDYETARSALAAARAEFMAGREEIAFNMKRDQLAAERAVKVARAALEAAERNLRLLGLDGEQIDAVGTESEDQLSRYELRSPVAGRIVEHHVSTGETAQTGDPLFVVADTSNMWLMADVRERDLLLLREGVNVLFTVDGLPGVGFDGRLNWISSWIDERTRTVRVRADLPNDDGLLRAKMFGQARLIVRDNANVLSVPREAVQTDGCCQLVFVQEDETAFAPRKVLLGADANGYVEILKGLEQGQQVVTTGSFLMKTEILKSNIGAGCCEVDPGR